MKKEYRCVARTKRMIRLAFTELLDEKKNIESITVSAIVKRADIAKSTFYNHYSDVYSVAEEFENELINELSVTLDEIAVVDSTEYEKYIKKLIEFLEENEDIYSRVIMSSNVRFFIDKLKLIVSKKMFEESTVFSLSQNKSERYAQIRFLTNASVDTMVDYFKGTLDVSLNKVGDIIISLLNRLR